MGADAPARTVIGVSTKAYFGAAQTRDWLREVRRIALELRPADHDVEVFVAPSFPFLVDAADALRDTGVTLAAQNVAPGAGAHTGEVPPGMLAELGVGIVEVGHAERRARFGDDDATVRAKCELVLDHGMRPLLCAGEPERTDPDAAADFVAGQVRSALGASGDSARSILAYEPVWAIGRPEPAPPEFVVKVIDGVRRLLRGSDAEPGTIIYGGSAGPGLLERLPGSDGLFLGRFAHDPGRLAAVIREACARG